MPSEGIRKNQSVGKAFVILEAMVDEGRAVRLLDLSHKLGIPSSTIGRFLNTLIDFGYVKQDKDSSRYFLTLKLATLGNKVYSRFSYQSLLKKYLLRISAELQESVSLSIEQDRKVVYIDAVEGPDHILQTLQRIGKVAPMHSTGAGKILLLNCNRAEWNRYIEDKGLPRYTPHTLTTKKEFIETMNAVLKNGYAYDNEECEVGVKCIAFPVRDFTGNVVNSISVSAPVSRMGKEREREIIKVLGRYTEEASTELGYQKPE